MPMTCRAVTDLAGQSVGCTLDAGHKTFHRNDLKHLEWSDPMTIDDATKPMDLDLSPDDRHLCAFAAGLYAARLETEAEKVAELGETIKARDLKNTAAGVRADLVEPDEAVRGQVIFRQCHRLAVEKGLEILQKRRKALAGTLRGADYPEQVEAVEDGAVYIGSHLLPLFQEQGTLPLEDPAEPEPAVAE